MNIPGSHDFMQYRYFASKITKNTLNEFEMKRINYEIMENHVFVNWYSFSQFAMRYPVHQSFFFQISLM